MLDTKTLLSSFKVSPPKLKIVHERQAIVQDVCDLMNDQRWTYWNGRTRRLSPAAIRDLIKEAQTGKNPQSFFNWLLKKELSNLK